jgi:GNAT superfamily N-acetyltransferase
MTVSADTARRQLGASAALWAGEDGVAVLEHGWAAFSGLASIDYNVVFSDGGGDTLDECVERITEAHVPTVLMVAGRALAEVGRLVARSWVCIGATPVMGLTLDGWVADAAVPGEPSARRLSPGDLAEARDLITDAFEISAQEARVALPDSLDGRDPMRSAWAAYDSEQRMCACLALVLVQDSAVVWSMATAADRRGEGHGRRALGAGLSALSAQGAVRSILYASVAGEPFYRRLGYTEIERWQMWSRPRWVLGRS